MAVGSTVQLIPTLLMHDETPRSYEIAAPSYYLLLIPYVNAIILARRQDR